MRLLPLRGKGRDGGPGDDNVRLLLPADAVDLVQQLDHLLAIVEENRVPLRHGACLLLEPALLLADFALPLWGEREKKKRKVRRGAMWRDVARQGDVS